MKVFPRYLALILLVGMVAEVFDAAHFSVGGWLGNLGFFIGLGVFWSIVASRDSYGPRKPKPPKMTRAQRDAFEAEWLRRFPPRGRNHS